MLPKVTKQIGLTHCGLASIANCTSYFGHFSPVVDANDVECCIEDVWPGVPDRTWLTYEKLFAAVNTLQCTGW